MADIVRAGSLWGYCQLTQFLAQDPSALLADAGLSRTDLDNPDKYLPRPAVASLLEHTAATLQCPDFGLRLAGVQDVYILGALAFAVRNALDLRNAVAITSKHIHYQAPMATLSIESFENGEELIVFHAPPSTNGAAAQYTEHALGLFCRVVRQLTNNRAAADRVTFKHRQIGAEAEYDEYLGLQPVFNAAVDSVLLGKDDLCIPLGPANQHLQTLVESYLDMYAPAPRAEIERQAHEALMSIMRAGPASIDDVSDMLRMHPRTLQRRLMASGTTFERVRDNVRRSMAEFYLASDMVPLAEVAHLLGYANQSALTRSCVRWFGTTPLAFRQNLRRKQLAN